jgi:hypothetical protein
MAADPEYRERILKQGRERVKRNWHDPEKREHISRKQSVYKRKNRAEWKLEAMNVLGGPRCSHCGYDKDIRALQIDHVNGDGHAYRKANKTMNGVAFYKFVVETKGKGLQVLCANCNTIKKFECKEYRHKYQ